MERLVTIGLQGGAMVFFLGLGVLHPRVAGQGFLNRDSWINLVTGALLFAFRLGLGYALGYLGVGDGFGLLDLGGLPPAVQWLLAFLLLDFTRYWVHYADHRIGFLWQFHAVHHSSEVLDATSGLRMHVVDLFQLTLIPLALFSMLIDQASLAPWVVVLALAPGMVFDAFQHANIAVDTSSPLYKTWNLLLNNPHFHSWHHTRDGHLRDGNYGNTLTIWDRIFGTDVTSDDSPEALGLPPDQALHNGVIGLQLLKKRA